MTEEFKAGQKVLKIGGRYGGPGVIVGETVDLDNSGYKLYNVSMKVEGGYGAFVHVFPANVLKIDDTNPTDLDQYVTKLESSLSKLKTSVFKGPWELEEQIQTDLSPKHREYGLMNAEGAIMCSTENCDYRFGMIESEVDDDGVYAWNENSERLMTYLSLFSPEKFQDLLKEYKELKGKSTESNSINVARLIDGIVEVKDLIEQVIIPEVEPAMLDKMQAIVSLLDLAVSEANKKKV